MSAQGNGTGAAIAYCPSGTRPLSGGGIEEGTGYIWFSAAVEDANGIGWAVLGNASSPMTAFAYCSAGVSKFTFPDGTVRALTREKIARMRAARSK